MSNNNLDVNNHFCYTNDSKQINLNSSNASIYLNLNKSMKSNVTFFFDNPLIYNETHTLIKKFSIVNCVFPVSYYLINDSNNYIIISVNGQPNITYTFPNGNYNINDFIKQWALTVGNTWTLTYNNINNKLTFQYPTVFTFTNTPIFSILGFDKNIAYYTSYISGSSYQLIPPYIINFGGFLKLNILTSSFNFKNVDSKKGENNIIASIPVNCAHNGYIQFNNFTNFNFIFKNNQISDLNIMVQDEFGNYVDFNNIDWSITLQIDTISRILDNQFSLEDIYKDYSLNYNLK